MTRTSPALMRVSPLGMTVLLLRRMRITSSPPEGENSAIRFSAQGLSAADGLLSQQKTRRLHEGAGR